MDVQVQSMDVFKSDPALVARIITELAIATGIFPCSCQKKKDSTTADEKEKKNRIAGRPKAEKRQ